ncbi:MAG: GyrI-like domain-containing protein [Candidatus Limnocylindria bacterium]
MIATEARPTTHFQTGDLRVLASARRDRVRFVEVPDARYLAIDGTEEPGSPTFVAGIGTLYRTAYTLQGQLRGKGFRTRVGMLGGLFWLTPRQLLAERPTEVTARTGLRWRLVLDVPDEATENDVDAAVATLPEDPVGHRIYLDRWHEGPSAQILHVGPYGAETASLRRLHASIAEAGFRPHGPHHEIWLNEPNRVGEERAKTVLRQPVMPA